jgi:hypothetical protein
MDDDYDTPWKEVVTRYFPEFMAFYFPDAHALIDWSRPYAFLDQELAALSRISSRITIACMTATAGRWQVWRCWRTTARSGGQRAFRIVCSAAKCAWLFRL